MIMQTPRKKCLHCGKIFSPYVIVCPICLREYSMYIQRIACIQCKAVLAKHYLKGKPRSNRKFCDIRCRTRYASKKRYKRLKNNPKFKRAMQDYHRIWRIRNRQKWGDLCRKNMQRKYHYNPLIRRRQTIKPKYSPKKKGEHVLNLF